jgi:hypothetical protein
MSARPDLQLPLALSGSWEHALFLSYGLNLPFFERMILPNLPGTCRNRILLGDEKTYLGSCDHFADSGLVRYANSQYVAEPILRRPSSHAKLVLLTNSEAGWLALGSGNVAMQGFASGGELFTAYTYTGEDEGSLAEFVAVRGLLERFRDRDLLTRTAAWHVDLLLEGSPWLFRATPGPSRVRHNLDTSFLDQLSEAVGDDHVEHLWVLVPFFDQHAQALGDLLDRLRPDVTTVLLQRGRTSVDPVALTKLSATSAGRIELRSVSRADDPWIHAKLFLAQTPTSAICLQGSANASLAALRYTDPDANFEMGNLLHGSRDAFDDVLEGLDIGGPVADASDLDVAYQSSKDRDHLDEAGWQLTGAEWSDLTLRISYRGVLPATAGLQLIVQGTTVPVQAADEGPPLVLQFADEPREHLGTASPIRLEFPDGTRSNAVFPCDRASLSATLHASPDSDGRLTRIGDLDLDDEEIELLLQELEATMVLDRRSLWQLAGERRSTEETAGGDEPHIDYSDIDYEMLRGHPKLRQYRLGRAGAGTHGRSRLQILLNAITQSFADLLDPPDASTAAAVAAVAAEGDKGVQTDDIDSDEEEVEVHRRRWSRQARINVLLRNFIRRFVSGLTSTAFQDDVGPEVVGTNYVIFLHLLSRLYEREWVDAKALVEATAQMIEAMWGSDEDPAYVARLEPDESENIMCFVREKHSDAQLLAFVYLLARDLQQSHSTDLLILIRIRDAWRGLLVDGRLPLNRAVLGDTAVLLRPVQPPDGPPLTHVVEQLRQLAEFRTREEFIDTLHQRFGTSRGSWYFDAVTVRIPPSRHDVSAECLLIEDDNITFAVEDAQWTLAAWMQVEHREYYRVQVRSRRGSRSTRFVAFYELALQRGHYAALGPGGHSVALTSLRPPEAPWDDSMLALMVAAEQQDEARTWTTTERASG